jgi:uncharacterized membrane protein
MPGEERTYTLSVHNIGNIHDTYRISLENYPLDWKLKFLESADPHNITVSLDSNIFEGAENQTQIQLTVWVPEEEQGGDVTFITVEGVSVFSEAEQLKDHPLMGLIKRSDTMLIKVGDEPKLQLFCEEDEKYILPGETAKYKVTVKNNGNVDFNVPLLYSEPSEGWTVKMKSAVQVRSGGSEIVEVFLTAPEEKYKVKAGRHEMITIEGVVDTAKGVLSSSVGIVGVLDSVYHLNLSVTPEINSTMPGGSVKYTLLIENLGNGEDELKLSPLSLELGWNMTFSNGEKFIIEWQETLSVEFEMRVPEDALAGTYTSILNVSDSNPYEKNFVSVKTRVLQTYDVSVGVYNEEYDLYMPETTQYITPGTSTMFDILVSNNGNGEDIANLSLYLYEYTKPTSGTVAKTPAESDAMMETAVESGGVRWYFKSISSSRSALSSEPIVTDFNKVIPVDRAAEVIYQPSSSVAYPTQAALLLFPGQHAWVQIEIDYPADENMDPINFAAEVSSDRGTDVQLENNRAELKLEVKYSDLTFDTTVGYKGLEILGDRSEKSPQLNIRITLRNIGEIEARNIEIALFVDGQFLDSRSIERMVNSSVSSGEFKDILISFAWKPIQGDHRIEVKIDPDNSIIESNEDNNAVSSTVDIKGSSDLMGALNDRKVCSIISVILIMIIITMIGHIILKKRKLESEK